MNRLLEVMRRIWFLLNRSRFEREMEEEIEEHRRQLGNPRAFGNTLRIREKSAEAWGWTGVEQALQDLRFAMRSLWASPVFTLGSISILAAGIALNLMVFEIVDTVLLRVPAIRDAQSMVRFYKSSPGHSSSSVPLRQAEYLGANNRDLAAVITSTSRNLAWGDDSADRVEVHFVSPNVFDELGYGPAAGRVLHAAIDGPGDAAPVVVLSHDFHARRLASDPAVIGATVRIDNQPIQVVGVAAANYPSLRPKRADMWLPIGQMRHWVSGAASDSWRSQGVEMYGRLRPGVTRASVRESLRATNAALSKEWPAEVREGEWLEPYPAESRFQSPRERRQMWTVAALGMALALLILAVACSNLANLVLSRCAARAHEISLRAALGAGRARLVRQQLMESCVLTCAGSALGVLGGRALLLLLLSRFDVPPGLDFSGDGRTVIAAVFLAAVSISVAGLIPALSATQGNLASRLRSPAVAGSRGLPTRRWLAGAQIAGSLVLVLTAGTFSQQTLRVLTSGTGFDFANVAVLDASLDRFHMTSAAARNFWETVRASLLANPGIEAVSIVSYAPLGTSLNEGTYDSDAPGIAVTSISAEPGLLRMLNIPLLRGRDFAPGDGHDSTAIIGRRIAEQMYGTIDVVGRTFPRTNGKRIIVGVTAGAGLVKVAASNTSELYTPLDPARYANYTLLAKARGNPAGVLGTLRQAARAADSRVLAASSTMQSGFERRVQPYRTTAAAISFTAAAALALAAAGVFGLVSFTVAQRTREIGIRRALGAGSASILGSLLGGLRAPVIAGTIGGVSGAAATCYALRAEPFYLAFGDPVTMCISVAVVLGAGAAAVIVPGLRAVALDPVRAIRFE